MGRVSMNKHIVQVFCLCIAGYFQLQSMQHLQMLEFENKKPKLYSQLNMQELHQIEARISIHHVNVLRYAGYKHLKNFECVDNHMHHLQGMHDNNGNELILKPHDILVRIYLNDADAYTRSICYYLDYLPLSWLENKKEGDALNFLYYYWPEGTSFRIRFILDANLQENTQTYLQALKFQFAQEPQFYPQDMKQLLEEGILIPNSQYIDCNDYSHVHNQACNKYLHGPNGYKFEQAVQNGDEMEFVENENDGRCIIN